MKVVRPYAVAEGDLASNVAETAPEWAAGTTYALGDYVHRATRTWKSLQAGNIGHVPETSTEWWFDMGATNRWAMFDQSTGTRTTRATPIVVTIDVAGRIDTIGLRNLSAAAVNITIEAGGDEVFNEDFSLVEDGGIDGWYDWLFEPITRKTTLTVTGLPNYAAPTVTITISGSGDVSVGHCVLGLVRKLGETEWGLDLGISDLSRKEKDEFGGWTLIERDYLDNIRLTAEVANGDVTWVRDLLAGLRATPVLVIGTETWAAASAFGLIQDWRIRIGEPFSILSATIEGF